MPAARQSTKAWLRAAGIRPRRAWGQNFLINPRLAEQIVAAWSVGPDHGVVEIGAGAGALTAPLLAAGATVVAVERDVALVDLLAERTAAEAAPGALRCVAGDIRAQSPEALCAGLAPPAGWGLVGNLPYALTTPILEWAGRHRHAFGWQAFMVQREYGERLTARPGQAAYGALTVWVASRFEIERQLRLGPANFWPIPKVDSIVVRLRPRPEPPPGRPALAQLERVVRAAFSQRRKMLPKPLAAGLELAPERVVAALDAAGIDARRRAESCSLEEFYALTAALADLLSRPQAGR